VGDPEEDSDEFDEHDELWIKHFFINMKAHMKNSEKNSVQLKRLTTLL
jgi:hypothetical protein